MLTLALLRHAKSSWEDADLEDFDRPLNERGRAAASVMGAVLKEIELRPNLILCSPARRTRETLRLVAPSLQHCGADVAFADELYLTGPESLLQHVRGIPAAPRTVLLVGHNPGLHGLALMLLRTGDAKSITRLDDKYPTGGLAVFTFPQTCWRDVAPATGHLESFVIPRDRA